MSDDDTTLDDYLARGGKFSSPENASPRYRGELMRLMATFVDSELAGAAGFAARINDGPGIKERIAAARITLEKLDHGERVLKVMGDFGADIARYAKHHPWTARLDRSANIGATRAAGDMRLSVFHYPIVGWIDAVAMNVLMGRATVLQVDELSRVSYQPLGEIFSAILPRETRHAELGLEGLRAICGDSDGRALAQASIDYWMPRVAATFGTIGSTRFANLYRFGLRHETNEALREQWYAVVAPMLIGLGLAVP